MSTTTKMNLLDDLRATCHKPGIYFSMPADEYHKDKSLGSSNIKNIRKGPRHYQKTSWMNPKYRSTDTKATIVGTALHMIVLEGIEKFSKHYVRRPDSYSELSQSDKSAMTKAINAKLADHQKLLSADEYDLCVDAAQEISDHEDMRKSLVGGVNEVSIFWIDEATGVPCKGRLDRLKARGIGDIKTIANEDDRPLDVAAMYAIKKYRYDIQSAHYLTGLRTVIRQKGAVVVGAGASANELLLQVKSSLANNDFAYQLIFLQKSLSEVWSTVLSPENHIVRVATDHVHWALETFKAMYEKHGKERWPSTWRLGELHAEDMPGGEYGWH